LGRRKGKRNVVMLTLGTGVGGALLVDGRIVRGEKGMPVCWAILPSILLDVSAIVGIEDVWKLFSQLAHMKPKP
jgi:predicted NBD/HSP70 family sugar kinase